VISLDAAHALSDFRTLMLHSYEAPHVTSDILSVSSQRNQRYLSLTQGIEPFTDGNVRSMSDRQRLSQPGG